MAATDSRISNTIVNPLLIKERAAASFSPLEITHMLDDGPVKTEKRRKINQLVFADPVMQKYVRQKHTADRDQIYENALEKGVKLLELAAKYNWGEEEFNYVFEVPMEHDLAVAIHCLMFMPTIKKMGTEEQIKKWFPLAASLKITGTYAQTELGQGSNLKRLQTNAVFDEEKQEFVINTPFPTGMKWWPGGLARSANHVILMAQLVIKGKNYGLQPFMVPIRSMKDHTHLAGVETGSIGQVFSRMGLDNGYLILRNCRIPRENMLMRYAEVTPDGKFIRKASDKSAYGTMVLVRTMLVRWCFMWCSKATTIVTRYSAVRRQGEINPKEPSVQILDHVTQQQKIFPYLAQAYAFKFAEWDITQSYEVVCKQMDKGDYSGLAELHANTSGLKAYCTEASVECVETCRRACGGNGYTVNSGLVTMYMAALGAVTYEGDATVLYLQTARYLLKMFDSVCEGKRLAGGLDYLNHRPQRPTRIHELENHNFTPIIRAFNCRSYHMVHTACTKLKDDVKGGKAFHDAWNQHSGNMIKATKAHLEGYLVINYCQRVTWQQISPEAKEPLGDLCLLYSLTKILENAGDFLASETFDMDQLESIKELELSLYQKIRPEAVALVDAFDYPDEALSTALGNYDGNVYERLYQEAKNSPENKHEVDPAYLKVVRSYTAGQSRL